MAPSKKKKIAGKKAKASAPTKKTAGHKAATAKKPVPKKAKAAPKPTVLKKVAKKIAAALTPSALNSKAAKPKTKVSTDEVANVLKPLDDRILVVAEPASEMSAGGIIIPGTVDERPQRGSVVAVGRGRRNKKGMLRPLELSVGETVLFAESAGTKITLGGREMLILREDEVLGVVG